MARTVRTPFLLWFGGISLALTVVLVVASWGAWLSAFVLGTLFGGLGGALFFMSATLTGDAEGLTVARLTTTAKVRWADVERVATGGGNFVLYTKSGRVTAPSFEFWSGPQKHELINLLFAQLEARGVPFQGNSLRASTHVGDR